MNFAHRMRKFFGKHPFVYAIYSVIWFPFGAILTLLVYGTSEWKEVTLVAKDTFYHWPHSVMEEARRWDRDYNR